MRVVSLNVALPSVRHYGEAGREVFTGGDKSPVPQAMLRRENFDGDGQGDRENHGGPDKAVCVYPLDHYAHWEEALSCPLPPGAFGENLTVLGAVETAVRVGDVFRVGGAVVQVSQPRVPCWKIGAKNGYGRLAAEATRVGYTGFYLRVLSEGLVGAGDGFEIVEEHPDGISVADVNDVMYGRSRDPGLVRRLAGLPELAADRRAFFAKKRAKEERLGGIG